MKGLKKANCPATVRQQTELQGWPAAHRWDLKAADRMVAEDDPSVFHASTEVISSSKLFIYRGKSILQFINVPIVLEKNKPVTINSSPGTQSSWPSVFLCISSSPWVCTIQWLDFICFHLLLSGATHTLIMTCGDPQTTERKLVNVHLHTLDRAKATCSG